MSRTTTAKKRKMHRNGGIPTWEIGEDKLDRTLWFNSCVSSRPISSSSASASEWTRTRS